MKLRQYGPGRSQLDRIDVRSRRFEQGLEAFGRKIESVALPALPWLFAKPRRACSNALDHVGLGGRDAPPAPGRDPAQAAPPGQGVTLAGRTLPVAEPHHE